MVDLISRQEAIRWVKTECNPYGKPTLDFESGKKVIEHLEQMPSAWPEPQIIRCKDCVYHNPDDLVDWCDAWGNNTTDDAFCSYAKKRRNGG